MDSRQGDYTTGRRRGKRETTFERVALDFANEMLEAERCLVASGWLDPVALNNSAFELGLSGYHFCDTLPSILYCYLCLCADNDRAPSPAEFCDLANRNLVVVSEDELIELVLGTRTQAGQIREYALLVIDFASRRSRARRCLALAAHLLSGDPGAFEVTVRRKRISTTQLPSGEAVHIPQHLRRRDWRRRHVG